MGKTRGLLQLIRPLNSLMMGFAVIVGASLVSSINFSLNLVLGFITAFMLTGASMAINDYYDREIDAINEPNRPIPSGAVNPKEAVFLALVLTLIGFLAAVQTSVLCLVVAAVAWIVSVAYITEGKRTGLLGNLLVSTNVVAPFIYGSFVVEKPELPIILFAAIAFLSNTGREVVKGIVDVEGDRSHNVGTVAVKYGERAAAVASSLLYVSAVGLSLLPWLWGLVADWFIPFVVLTDGGLIGSAISLLKDQSRRNARRVKNLTLLWFTTGLLAFFAGRL